MTNDPLLTSKKDAARELNRNPRYVRDMERAGFKLPARLSEAVRFLRKNPHPTKFRKKT